MICEIILRRHKVWTDRRFRQSWHGAEAIEFVEGAVEGALDAGFVAREAFDSAGSGGVIGEGAGAGIEGRQVFVARELRHTEIEQTGFERAHAAETPGGHGHLFDEQGFGGPGGLVFREKGVEQLLELLGILVRENGGLGGEPVAKRVEADGGASFGGTRAGGELGVATIGVELTLRGHRV